MIKVLLDGTDLYELFRGRIILKQQSAKKSQAIMAGSTERVQLEIAIADLGWVEMLLCLSHAMRDAKGIEFDER